LHQCKVQLQEKCKPKFADKDSETILKRVQHKVQDDNRQAIVDIRVMLNLFQHLLEN